VLARLHKAAIADGCVVALAALTATRLLIKAAACRPRARAAAAPAGRRRAVGSSSQPEEGAFMHRQKHHPTITGAAVAIVALLLTSGTHTSAQTRKGVYGSKDDRLDESATSGIPAAVRAAAAATVALVPKHRLRYNRTDNTWVTAFVPTLQAAQNLCPTDANAGGAPTRFKDQLVPATCSGTVVHWNP
jgi:hypothetical protein